MSLDFLNNYLTIIIFLVISLFLSFGFLVLNLAFSPKNPDPEKLSAYECGFEPFNDREWNLTLGFTWSRYYLLYLI